MRAMIGIGRSRLALGRDVRLVAAADDGVWVESGVRLRPGQSVDLTGEWPGAGSHSRARVVSWRVVRLGAEGPIYRGNLRFD